MPRRQHWDGTAMDTLFLVPVVQIFTFGFTIIIGSSLVTFFNSPVFVLLPLVILKTLVDVVGHFLRRKIVGIK
jgi:hypothetical protein